MKIKSVKTFLADGGFRPWTFVRVETDNGLIGWGIAPIGAARNR